MCAFSNKYNGLISIGFFSLNLKILKVTQKVNTMLRSANERVDFIYEFYALIFSPVKSTMHRNIKIYDT